MSLSLRVLARPEEKMLPEIYRNLGVDFDERVLPSIANEVLKATVAQYDADQLLTLREKVSRQIREALNERAAEFHLILDGKPLHCFDLPQHARLCVGLFFPSFGSAHLLNYVPLSLQTSPSHT